MGKILVYILIVIAIAAEIFPAEIHDVAQSGDLARLKSLLDGNPELMELKDSLGTTPLLAAVSAGQTEVIEFLYKSGADLKTSNNRGSTALHLAAFGGYTDLVKFFLAAGLKIDSANASGNTPLILACMRGHIEAAKVLIENGADLTIQDRRWGGAPLHWACRQDSIGILDLLVKRGVDLNTPGGVDGATPMAWAIYSDNLKAVEYLLAHGVDVNSYSGEYLPLNMAIGGGHQEIIRFLIESGARTDIAESSGQTPLHIASEIGDTTLVELFLNKDANTNQPDSSGLTPLHWAAVRGYLRVTEILLSHGADVDARDKTGKTPLFWTCQNMSDSVAAILLKSGADVNSTDDEGVSPLLTALIGGCTEPAELCLNHGTDVKLRDKLYGRNALHWAAINGYGNTAALLIKKGSDINIPDSAGQTPLFYAEKYGHQELAGMLKKNGALDDSGTGDSKAAAESTIAPGEAVIRYLGNCGFAVKTAGHLLLFDYYNPGTPPDQPSLANGRVIPEEIAGENVSVFVTHDHQDHFDTAIFDWKESLPDINYVFGFRPENLPRYLDSGYTGPAYEYLAPRESRQIGDMKVTTIAANDAGVGFIVEVDGLTIYHAGDHAGWRPGQRDAFNAEIDFIAENIPAIDVAFLNATGCHVQDTIALAGSIQYTLNKLNPVCWFPTHGLNREYVLKNMAASVAAAGCISPAICVGNRGDRYIYTKGKIIPL